MEVLVEIQRRALTVRVVVLTMSAQPQHVAEALRLGASGYVLKGAPASEVLRAIDAVVLGKRYLGQEVADLAVQALTGDAGSDPFATLSPRERQIVAMVVRGQSSAAVGRELHLSPKTIDTYRSRLMAKLGVGDVTALVRLAMRHGLVEDDGA
jgi:DNA-binding NarL/FixJ family response regulator